MERNHILDIVKIDFSPPIFIVGNLVFLAYITYPKKSCNYLPALHDTMVKLSFVASLYKILKATSNVLTILGGLLVVAFDQLQPFHIIAIIGKVWV
jgi:hypothetical protein